MSPLDRLVLCTSNSGKVVEFQNGLPSGIQLLTLRDVGISEAVPETGGTMKVNAAQKAIHVFRRSRIPCLADDSGLEVNALGGAPGVFSARYAGPEQRADANIRKLLNEMIGIDDRTALFRTVLALYNGMDMLFFEGVIEGRITSEPIGASGFGYDPIFIPKGYERTFAQMSLLEKNAISHRSMALRKLIHYLTE